MKFLGRIGFSLFALIFAFNVHALPPEIEADRLILAAKEKLEEGSFDGARAYLERVAPLEIDPPADYYLLFGRVHYEADAWQEAKTHFEKYVELAGKEGSAYIDTLKMITALEETLAGKQEQKASAPEAGSPIQLPEKQGQAYDKKVSDLYLDPNLTQSLVTHVNGLLKSYRFIEGKIKNIEKNNYIDFKLSLAKDKELVLTRRDIVRKLSGASSELSVSRLNAFGIDPDVAFRCSKETDSCTIKHPINQKEWIKIARDEKGAEEIAKALTRLLKALQRG